MSRRGPTPRSSGGQRVNPTVIKALLLQTKGWQHTVLIPICLELRRRSGERLPSRSGGMDVMKDNLCWLADGKGIAGSVLRAAQVSRTLSIGASPALISPFAWQPRCRLALRTSRIKCGSIMPGRDADFCRVRPRAHPSSRRMLAARASATPLPVTIQKTAGPNLLRTRRME